MSAELVFNIANNGILVFWLLLIVAPRWQGTQIAVHSIALPMILGTTYAWLLWRAMFGGEGAPGTSFTSLAGVMALFDAPVGATLGWIHYLVFDLFIGAWETRDAGRRGIAHWMVAPCLVLTLLVGPVGLLCYLLLRLALAKGGWSLAET
jgi:hypothetical protein